jgi:DNA-binding NarL/FixJ family response regulator/anti-sigma regulatory factor (Ser/Thr protein kinase)
MSSSANQISSGLSDVSEKSETSTHQTNTYQILIVDDDDVIRESIVSYLQDFYPEMALNAAHLKVYAADCVKSAKQVLSQHAIDLVITDINLPEEDGFALIRHIENDYPDTKSAMITAYKVDDYVKMAKKTGVFNIIPKTAPFNFLELSTVVQNLLNPSSAFGLAQYMNPETLKGGQIEEFVITNSDQIMDAFFKLREFFMGAQARRVDDLCTAMIEAMTNAVYHVAKLPDGSLKYQKGQRIEALEPEEYVSVFFGKDSDKLGVAIRDQGGRITADEVMYWLDRNISGSGLLDTHGRGVFLIHTLVDRLVINIAPGKRTEILVLDYFSNEYSSNKPLYINQF